MLSLLCYSRKDEVLGYCSEAGMGSPEQRKLRNSTHSAMRKSKEHGCHTVRNRNSFPHSN